MRNGLFITMAGLLLAVQFAHADNACRLRSDTTAELADAIDVRTSLQAQDLCSLMGATSTSADQTKLLERIRANAVRRIPALTNSLNAQQVAKAQSDWKQLRVLTALTGAEINYEGGIQGIRDGTARASVTLPPRVTYSPGFAETPDPFTARELQQASAALSASTATMLTHARAATNAQYDELYAMGINPDAPLAETAGQLKDRAMQDIRSAAQVGYREIVSSNPMLLFVKKAEPTAADLRAAQTKYAEALAGEASRLSALKLSPPEDAALALLFYGPAVNDAIKEDGKLCGAYNALKAEMTNRQKFRDMLATGVGVAAAGACVAASVFSAGLLGVGCFALSVAEFGVTAEGAIQSSIMENSMYKGVLQGGSLEDYVAQRDRARGYLIAAGFSVAGVAFGAADTLATMKPSPRPQSLSVDQLPAQKQVGSGGPTVPDDVRFLAISETSAWRQTYPRYDLPFSLPRDAPFETRLARLNELGLTREGPNNALIIPLGEPRTPMAQAIEQLRANGVEFRDAGAYMDGPYRYLGEDDGVAVLVTRDFFGDPAKAMEELESIAQMVALRKSFANRGVVLRPASNATTDEPALELVVNGNSYARNDPLLWIQNRQRRHGIRVVVDDSKFLGSEEGAMAFAQGDVVYLRTSALADLGKSAETIGHEIVHATNFVKCQKFGDCAGTIQFHSANEGQITRLPGYETYFRGDEMEAYLVTQKIAADPSFVREVQHFAASQKVMLNTLRRDILSGAVVRDPRTGAFTIDGFQGPVNIYFGGNKTFATGAEARAWHLRMIEQRLRQVDNRLLQIQGLLPKVTRPLAN